MAAAISESVRVHTDVYRPAVRVLRKPGDIVAVVHPVVGGGVEICSVPTTRRPHLAIARRVEVTVVYREQERIRGREWETELLNSEDAGHFGVVPALSWTDGPDGLKGERILYARQRYGNFLFKLPTANDFALALALALHL